LPLALLAASRATRLLGLLISLLFKINENQLALEAAIMELILWVEQRGTADVAENVRAHFGLSTKMRNLSR
jgi:hypothetical protein